MAWTEVSFGKYAGKTLPQIVLIDPDWFFWAFEEGVFKGSLRSQADVIQQKATQIRIPNEADEDLVAEYFIHPPTGKFGGLQIVERGRPLHEGSSPAFRRGWIDLSVPRTIHGYDKLGGRLLVKSLKRILFGSEGTSLTRKRCEAFFDDDENFI